MNVVWRKCKKPRPCTQCTREIPKDETYIHARAKVAPKFWISNVFHYECFCLWLAHRMTLPKKLKRRRKDMCADRGRPCRTLVEMIGGEAILRPLTIEQKKRRAVLTAQFHRYRHSARDTAEIVREMEELGGIPGSWSALLT